MKNLKNLEQIIKDPDSSAAEKWVALNFRQTSREKIEQKLDSPLSLEEN
jgi:hypothetical protein